MRNAATVNACRPTGDNRVNGTISAVVDDDISQSAQLMRTRFITIWLMHNFTAIFPVNMGQFTTSIFVLYLRLCTCAGMTWLFTSS